MPSALNNLKNYFHEVGISCLIYFLFAGLISFIPALKSGPLTFYLFLPAAAKLFTILIFKWRGAIGVGLGTFMRLILVDPSQSWMDWLMVAVITTFLLYVAIELTLKVLKIDLQLSNLKYYQIVLLALVSSIVNATAFVHSASWITGVELGDDIFHHNLLTILSNFAGNALFVCAAVFFLTHKVTIVNFFNQKTK